MEAAPSENAICFGLFKLDLKAGELHKEERRIRLQEQPFQILKMLLDRPGEIVTREEIRQQLWRNDTIVEFDHSINAGIKKLRLALGDSAEKPIYVETVARRGYRFIAPLKEAGPTIPPEKDPPEEILVSSEVEATILSRLRAEQEAPRGRKLTGLIWSVALSLSILLSAGWFYFHRPTSKPSTP
jgi:DNA-binding winged helix-turn-helix (wHTH) protein